MRLEATGNLELFLKTLDALGYPHPWPMEFMSACIKAFVKDANGELQGAAFYHWGPIPGHIYCHLIMRQSAIITRNAIGDFHKIPELMGGTELRVDLQAVPASMIEFARRGGWQKDKDGASWFIELNPCPWTHYTATAHEGKEAA